MIHHNCYIPIQENIKQKDGFLKFIKYDFAQLMFHHGC